MLLFYMNKIPSAMSYLYKNKHIALRDGNISFKPAFKNHFFITPGSVKKDNLKTSDLIKVIFTKEELFITNNHLNLKPSREISMHSMFHVKKEFYDKDLYVVHAHPKNLISYIGLYKNNELKTIKSLFPEINVNIGRNVGPYEAGSLQLANEAYKNLVNYDIVGLRNHGSLGIGNNLDKLIEHIETLEYYLQIANISNISIK